MGVDSASLSLDDGGKWHLGGVGAGLSAPMLSLGMQTEKSVAEDSGIWFSPEIRRSDCHSLEIPVESGGLEFGSS